MYRKTDRQTDRSHIMTQHFATYSSTTLPHPSPSPTPGQPIKTVKCRIMQPNCRISWAKKQTVQFTEIIPPRIYRNYKTQKSLSRHAARYSFCRVKKCVNSGMGCRYSDSPMLSVGLEVRVLVCSRLTALWIRKTN